MKIAIVGSRTFKDYAVLEDFIGKTIAEKDITIDTVISGGARGADALAERYAEEHNIPLQVFKADWDTYGRRAGFVRNQQMIESCDVCFVFWDGTSKGTKLSIDLCTRHNKPAYICYF